MKIARVTTATRPAITSTVGALSDRELLRETSNLVRHERHLQGAIIDHLADQPDAREGLRDGSLTLSAAAELQWAFDRQRRRGSISGTAAIAPAGSAAAGPAGTGAQNDPAADSAPAVPSSAEPEPPPLVLDAVGRQKLVEEAAGKSARQVRQMLADLDPELAPPADRVRPLGDGRYELKATIDADCRAAPAPARAVRPTPTSAPPPSTQEETARRTATGAKPTGAATPASKSRASGRAIPAAVRRQVWQRDGGRLQLRRCTDRAPVQLNASDRDRPHRPACAGRRRRSPKSQTSVWRAHHRHRHAQGRSPREPAP